MGKTEKDDNKDYYNEDEETDQISPAGIMTVAGFGFLMFMVMFTVLCVASPFWYQTWPNSFNTFQSLGLWEVCFSDYIHPKDDTMYVYSGCFQIYGSDPNIAKLREWLAPPWFITCCIFMVTTVLIEVVTVAILTFIFMHRCPMIHHEYHEIYGLFIAASFMFLSVLLITTTAALFGVQHDSRNWMMRPDLNFLSWGYGFCLTSGMLGLFAGASFWLEAKNAYNLILEREDIVLDNAETEALVRSREMLDAAGNSAYKAHPSQASFYTQPSFALPPDYDLALQSVAVAGYPLMGTGYPYQAAQPAAVYPPQNGYPHGEYQVPADYPEDEVHYDPSYYSAAAAAYQAVPTPFYASNQNYSGPPIVRYHDIDESQQKKFNLIDDDVEHVQ